MADRADIEDEDEEPAEAVDAVSLAGMLDVWLELVIKRGEGCAFGAEGEADLVVVLVLLVVGFEHR